MRITTLYFEDTAESVSRMSAPVPDAPALAQLSSEAAWDVFERATFPDLLAHPTALSASSNDSSEAAWDVFERATFPDLTR